MEANRNDIFSAIIILLLAVIFFVLGMLVQQTPSKEQFSDLETKVNSIDQTLFQITQDLEFEPIQ